MEAHPWVSLRQVHPGRLRATFLTLTLQESLFKFSLSHIDLITLSMLQVAQLGNLTVSMLLEHSPNTRIGQLNFLNLFLVAVMDLLLKLFQLCVNLLPALVPWWLTIGRALVVMIILITIVVDACRSLSCSRKPTLTEFTHTDYVAICTLLLP